MGKNLFIRCYHWILVYRDVFSITNILLISLNFMDLQTAVQVMGSHLRKSYKLSWNMLQVLLIQLGKVCWNNDPFGIKMLTRMKLDFSHLQHKCRQGFKDTLNPLCSWSIRAENITHYFLRWYFYISNLANLMNDFKILPLSLLKLVITTLLLFFYMAMISSMTQIIRKC